MGNPAEDRANTSPYGELFRFEGRVTDQQWKDLTALRMHLARQRGSRAAGPGDRITNNTLIRVAIAGLLHHEDALHGATEAELTQAWLQHIAPD